MTSPKQNNQSVKQGIIVCKKHKEIFHSDWLPEHLEEYHVTDRRIGKA